MSTLHILALWFGGTIHWGEHFDGFDHLNSQNLERFIHEFAAYYRNLI